MQIDRKALEGLLALNDKQLMSIIGRLAAGSGIDLSQFNIDPRSISSIRSAISSATDEDLEHIVAQYEASKSNGGKR